MFRPCLTPRPAPGPVRCGELRPPVASAPAPSALDANDPPKREAAGELRAGAAKAQITGKKALPFGDPPYAAPAGANLFYAKAAEVLKKL